MMVRLRGTTELNEGIWIPEFRITEFTNARDQVSLRGVAEFFIKGDVGEFDASGGTIICAAIIPLTPIALSHASYEPTEDGVITLAQGSERRGIRWSTGLGEAELIDKYHYLHEKIGSDNALVQVQRCQISIAVRPEGTVSLPTILLNLREILDDALWLLSFLGRKRTAWYQGEAVFSPEEYSSGSIRAATARREQWLGFQNDEKAAASSGDVLVRQNLLRDGLFQQLLANYQASQFHDTIRRIIPFLLGAHESGYFEAQYVSAWSALEGLVDDLGEEADVTYLLKRGAFDRLSKKLRDFIRSEVKDGDIAAGVITKLPELRRRSFRERLEILVEEYGLNLARLWPAGSDIVSELRDLVQRRDVFVHRGRMDDLDLYASDLRHVQRLVELWTLRLLDCPDEATNASALRVIPLARP